MLPLAFTIGLTQILLWSYYVLINLVTFATFWRDKRLAQKDKWRVRERTLFAMGFLGGWIGMIFGMRKFRHKTRKFSFLFMAGLIVIWNLWWLWVYVRPDGG